MLPLAQAPPPPIDPSWLASLLGPNGLTVASLVAVVVLWREIGKRDAKIDALTAKAQETGLAALKAIEALGNRPGGPA